jgi:hypothetical protein
MQRFAESCLLAVHGTLATSWKRPSVSVDSGFLLTERKAGHARPCREEILDYSGEKGTPFLFSIYHMLL